MGKSAQFPLHVWLPDAMEGPTPVSALIHAATMVTAGVYLLTRLEWLFALTPEVLAIVAWIGAVTALLAAVLACVQTDIKRVLAYSTVSQLGYMMAAIGAGFAGAGFLHLLTHGVFKALLFLGAGAVIHAVAHNDMPAMGGLARKMPQTRSCFSSARCRSPACRSLPGSSRRKKCSARCGPAASPCRSSCCCSAAFLTAFYMFRVVFLVVLRRSRRRASRHARTRTRRASRTPRTPTTRRSVMTVPLWVLALHRDGDRHLFHACGHREAEFHAPGWLAPVGDRAWRCPASCSRGSPTSAGSISADTLADAFGPIRRAALAKFWLDDVYRRRLPLRAAGVRRASSAGSIATSSTAS